MFPVLVLPVAFVFGILLAKKYKKPKKRNVHEIIIDHICRLLDNNPTLEILYFLADKITLCVKITGDVPDDLKHNFLTLSSTFTEKLAIDYYHANYGDLFEDLAAAIQYLETKKRNNMDSCVLSILTNVNRVINESNLKKDMDDWNESINNILN